MSNQNRIRDSLKFSFWDGVFAVSMLGLVNDYITPYALSLRATISQIGLLSAIPNFIAALVQLKSADLVDTLKSRKLIINLFVFFQACILLPILFIPYIFKTGQVTFLIIFVTFFTSLGAFSVPAWASLMSEYIPVRKRGKYFGWRSKILGTATILATFSSGFILHCFKDNLRLGFSMIFGLAFIFRLISWYFLTRMYEPQYRLHKDTYFSFFDFLTRIRESNFAKFVLFVSGMNFCVNLAAPFFSVFMLKDLQFNYLTYTLLVISVLIAQILTFDRWGRHADKVGNLKVVKFTAFFIASLPLWWIINRNPAYLVFIQLMGGFAWAGFNLCATNFIYDSVKPEKRTRCFAYFNVCNGLGVCLGALIGGYLVNILPGLLGYKILSLFLISSILRFGIIFLISGRISEVRSAERVSSRDLFYSVVGLRPIQGHANEPTQLTREEE